MKFSVALAACVAPLALAKAVQNAYPVKRGGNKANLDGVFRNNGLSGFGITETSLTEVILIWANAGGNSQTQLLNSQVTVTQTVTVQAGAAATVLPGQQGSNTIAAGASTVVSGAAATHSVVLGGSAGLVFVPDTLEANVGDMVIFTFLSSNHTATQSAFATPCEALAGGMDSGFMPNPNNTVTPPPQVAMQIMTKDPLWFYCRQKGHCGKGMAFSINPSAAKTQAMFQQMAIAQNGTGSPSAITGGTSNAPPAAAPPAASESSLSALPSSGASSTDSLAPLPGSTGTTSANSGSSVQSGTGTLNADGSCTCFVSCDSGSLPKMAAQGLNAFGGMSGSLPSSNVETTT